ncbi:PTS sugar transporter subunit IIA [Leptolinea tardivitalis]|uniref:PTS sugar transporter subunit IIA n=1 Tax=Leptolinea tardivitalis TaxID=229920 RepID=A0A0P6XBA7_9CHLR|nr:PTS sugar transporter subunit IIA [Leptolinea tardivitalis]KPL72527.1 PTS sugar transporter subunit IIA [Leptolinea tardivitalis]GAP21179.1 PTS system IIA component, Gat family [Leptolinea tardivitalis]
MSNKLLQLLDSEAVCLKMDARDAADVIENLGIRLYIDGYVKDTFVDAAMAREKKLPTGLPLGGEVNAAIPHTDVIHVLKPGVAMATLKRPVIFKNMISPDEDVNVQLVFLLSLEQPKSQIEMLQEIASVLQRPETVEKLMAATTFEDVQAALA